MATLDFPSNPQVGQKVTTNGKEYIWTGESWSNTGLGLFGQRGPVGYQGSAGIQGPRGEAGAGAIITVPGANTQVVYNNNGNLGASTGFTFDQGTGNVNVSGRIQASFIQTTPIGIRSDGTVATAAGGRFTTLTALNTVQLTPAVNENITATTTGTGTISLSSGGVGSINNMTIGMTTPREGRFVGLQSTGAANIVLTTSGTNTITMTSGGAGSINNMTIGQTGPRAGSFTTVSATTSVTTAQLSASSINFSGGQLNNVTIGQNVPSAGRFTSLQVLANMDGALYVASESEARVVLNEQTLQYSIAGAITLEGGIAAAKNLLTAQDLVMTGTDSTIQVSRPFYEPPRPGQTFAHIYVGEYGGFNTTRRLLLSQKDDFGIVSNLQPFLGQKQIFNWYPSIACLWPGGTAPTTRLNDANSFFQVNQHSASSISMPFPSMNGTESDSYTRSRKARYTSTGTAVNNWAGQVAERSNAFLTVGNNGSVASDSNITNPLGGFFYTCRFGLPEANFDQNQAARRPGFFVGLGESKLEVASLLGATGYPGTTTGQSVQYGMLGTPYHYVDVEANATNIDPVTDESILIGEEARRYFTNLVRVKLFPLSGAVLPPPLAINTYYFVKVIPNSNNKIQLSTTSGGAAVALTGTGSGTFRIMHDPVDGFNPVVALNHIGVGTRGSNDAAFVLCLNGSRVNPETQSLLSLYQKVFSPKQAKTVVFNPTDSNQYSNITGTFTIIGHGLQDGDSIIYQVYGSPVTNRRSIQYTSGGNTINLESSTNNAYYVKKVNDDNFQLCLSLEAVALNNTINTFLPYTATGNFSVLHSFTRSGILLGTNQIIVPNHGFNTGNVIIYFNGMIADEGENAPAGNQLKYSLNNTANPFTDSSLWANLSALTTVYYVTRIDRNTLSVSLNKTQSAVPAYTRSIKNAVAGNVVLGLGAIPAANFSRMDNFFNQPVYYQPDTQASTIPTLTPGNASSGPAYYLRSVNNPKSGVLSDNVNAVLGRKLWDLWTPSISRDVSFIEGGLLPFDPIDVVDTTTNLFNYSDHGYSTGTPVFYFKDLNAYDGSNSGPNTTISGLTSGTSVKYYIRRENAHQFGLATSLQNAQTGNIVQLNDQGAGSADHIIALANPDGTATVGAGINTLTGIISIPNHGFVDQQPIFYKSSGTSKLKWVNSAIAFKTTTAANSTVFLNTYGTTTAQQFLRNTLKVPNHGFYDGSVVRLWWSGTTVPFTTSPAISKDVDYIVRLLDYNNSNFDKREGYHHIKLERLDGSAVVITASSATDISVRIVGTSDIPSSIDGIANVSTRNAKETISYPLWVNRISNNIFRISDRFTDTNITRDSLRGNGTLAVNNPRTTLDVDYNDRTFQRTFAPSAVSIADDTFTIPNHGFNNEMPLVYVPGTASVSYTHSPGGVPTTVLFSNIPKRTVYCSFSGIATSAQANTFKVSLTPGGNPVNINAIGTGTHTFIGVEDRSISVPSGTFYWRAHHLIEGQTLGYDSNGNMGISFGWANGAQPNDNNQVIGNSIQLRNGSFSTTGSNITATAHGLRTGQPIIYRSGRSTAGAVNTAIPVATASTTGVTASFFEQATGDWRLRDGTTYYAVYVDANTFRIATSPTRAYEGTVVTFRAVGTGQAALATSDSHTFTTYGNRVNFVITDVSEHTFRVQAGASTIGTPATVSAYGSGTHTFRELVISNSSATGATPAGVAGITPWVDETTDTITIYSHRLNAGDAVIYNTGGNANSGIDINNADLADYTELKNGKTLFVAKIDADKFKLAATYNNAILASTFINTTSAGDVDTSYGTGDQTKVIDILNPGTEGQIKSQNLFNPSTAVTSDGIFTIPNHGYKNNEVVYYYTPSASSNSRLISTVGDLTPGTPYVINRLSKDTFTIRNFGSTTDLEFTTRPNTAGHGFAGSKNYHFLTRVYASYRDITSIPTNVTHNFNNGGEFINLSSAPNGTGTLSTFGTPVYIQAEGGGGTNPSTNYHTISYGDFSTGALGSMFELSIYAPTYWLPNESGQLVPTLTITLKNLTSGNTLSYDVQDELDQNGNPVGNIPLASTFLGHKAFIITPNGVGLPYPVSLDVMSVYMETDFDIKHETQG